jgi:CHASE2 domain-containing sensor protein
MAGTLRPAILLAAAGVAALTILLLGYLSARTPLFNTFEYWTSDWRTAFFAQKLPGQHPRLAIVMIDDATLAGYPYRSPMDRGLLAKLVKTVDGAGARVIGLDFIFDQATEAGKDKALLDAIKSSSGKIVLGVLDERTGLDEKRLAYNRTFIANSGAKAGLLNMRVELDGTVRSLPNAPAGKRNFSEAMAEAAGAHIPASRSMRVAWLGKPDGEETFLTIPAERLLRAENVSENERALRNRLLSALRGRIVLIGANLSDSADRFTTPLSKLNGNAMPGAIVQTQAVAQLLDGRFYHELSHEIALAVAGLVAFTGFLLGWRFFPSGMLLSVVPILVYLIADVIAFSIFGIILPFALLAAAWLIGAITGQGVHWLGKRRAKSQAALGGSS